MPARSRSYHDCKQFCRSSSICGSFFAMIWCINMLISAVTSLGYVSKFFDEWIEADALIIGRNITVHHRNSNRDERHLIGSDIPDFATEDLLGNQTNPFDNSTVGNNSFKDGLFNSSLQNTTGDENKSIQGDSNITPNNGDSDLNEDSDMDDTDTNSATTPPTTPPGDTVGFGGRLVYCAEVQFQIDDNITITAVSATYCSYEMSDIVVGQTFGILYNPLNPQDIIEESLYSHAQNTLRLTVGVTVFFTLGYLLCSIYLWRSQPDMSRSLFPHTGRDFDIQDGNPNEIAQSREEREALMKSKFHFQTVLEDLSNTDAASIRRLCLTVGGDDQSARQAGCSCNKADESPNGLETRLHDDIEAQQQPKRDQLQRNFDKDEDDLELDLTKRDTRDEISTSNTETETDTDAGSNNLSSEQTETNDIKQPQQQKQSHEQESAWSIAGATNLISSWTNAALAPSAPECCICLETYQPGDKICTAKRDACDHVFHQKCIEGWLYRHDACPLCRVDLMNSEE